MWDENGCWKTEREREAKREGRKRDTFLLIMSKKQENNTGVFAVNKHTHDYADVQSDCNVLECTIRHYILHIGMYSAHIEVIRLIAFSSLTQIANYKAIFHNRKNCLNKTITIVNTKHLHWLPKRGKN